MIEALISSKTRIKLLQRFFLNPENTAHLRGLAEEFGESTNAIRLELNKFEKAGMLDTESNGNKKLFKANKKHPLFPDIRNIIMKHMGIDTLVDYLVTRLGNPEKVYLTGDFAKGKASDIIDIVIVGHIDKSYLVELVEKAEEKLCKRIRYLTYLPGEFTIPEEEKRHYVLIWNQ